MTVSAVAHNVGVIVPVRCAIRLQSVRRVVLRRRLLAYQGERGAVAPLDYRFSFSRASDFRLCGAICCGSTDVHN